MGTLRMGWYYWYLRENTEMKKGQELEGFYVCLSITDEVQYTLLDKKVYFLHIIAWR